MLDHSMDNPEEKIKSLVSVIIPCFNPRKEQLLRAINSVLSQKYKEVEIIVVDDGSNEPFGGANKDFNDPKNIIWHKLEENSGVAVARNTGVDLASGLYVAFLDCDDWWCAEKLSNQVKEAEKGFDFVFSSSVLVYPNFNRLCQASMDNAEKKILVENILNLSSVLIKKEVFMEEGGFLEGEDLPEDYELWIRLLTRYRSSCVGDVYAYIDRRFESRSTNWRIKARTYKRLRQIHMKTIREAGMWRLSMSSYHMVIATLQFRNNDFFPMVLSVSKAFFWSPSYVVSRIIGQFNIKYMHEPAGG